MADDDRRWETGSAHGEREGFKPSARQIGAGVVGFLLLVFVLQNTDSTSLTVLLFEVTFPLWLVLAGTILLSLGVGYVLGGRRRRGR